MNHKVIHVAIADDHPLVIAALRDFLRKATGFEITCECADGNELIAALDTHAADIAITDFSMGHGDAAPDGFNLLNRLARRHPATRVVVLSAQSNAAVIRRAMKLGVRAFVSKEDDLREVARACMHIMAGDGCFYSPSARCMLENAALAEAPATDLTQRELEVVRLYAQGYRLSEIAAKLGRSVSTISSQKTVAMRKLGVPTNTSLIRYAYDNRLI